MRVLITGVTGFVGSHLADYIFENHPGVAVDGLVRWRSSRENIAHLEDRLSLHEGDLLDMASLVRVLDQVRPDRIFHLAAQSYVQASYASPSATMQVNALGTQNLLEAVMLKDEAPLIHVCSSSEVYGRIEQRDIPVLESCVPRPVSHYGVSKLAADSIAYAYFTSHGLRTIRSRAFTHSGPRRGDVFVDSSFARQIARIELGKQESVLRVGNLNSVRTFCDVRDMVRAYWLLLEHGAPGEVYNIGGRETMPIQDIVKMLLEMTSHPNSIAVSEESSRLRFADVTNQVPDTGKFMALTGWRPEIRYKQTLMDMLNYWRSYEQHDTDNLVWWPGDKTELRAP